VYQDIPGYGLDITRMHQARNVGNGTSNRAAVKNLRDFLVVFGFALYDWNAVDVPKHFYHVLSDAYHDAIMWLSCGFQMYP
jgi:hypothetical protein